jgi:hypothetical protein
MLTTWPFVVSVVLLIINDRWFKSAYPGIVSGKLSDFAGIALATLLLLALVPGRRWLVYGVIVGAFAWWKSAFSQAAIDAVASYIPIGRTVDYTDLVAFLALPFCDVVARRTQDFAIPSEHLRRLLVGPVVALTLFGLMATSFIAPPLQQSYQFKGSEQTADFDRAAIARDIAQYMARYGFDCLECSDLTTGARYSGDDLVFQYAFTGSKVLSINVTIEPQAPRMFATSNWETANSLREYLKSYFASRHMNIEYIEQLYPPTRY